MLYKHVIWAQLEGNPYIINVVCFNNTTDYIIMKTDIPFGM